MKVFGMELSFRKKDAAVPAPAWDFSPGGGWWPVIRESFTGAWQRNIVAPDVGGAFYADFACKTLIARDIAKNRVKLMAVDSAGLIWTEIQNHPAFGPVLRVPNHYQTRNQFWENWILSKLNTGNTYILKGRDQRRIVTALYVLDPRRVKPVVTDEGDVYYQLGTDNLAETDGETVPASEIIHDRFNCLFHPLVGMPPLYANGLAAMQGLNMQTHSAKLFQNGAQPGGILTGPGLINKQTADRLKEDWEKNYGGRNFGRVAVLGDGLKYEKMAMTAVEGQMIEQLRWTAEVVCSTYHVPPYKIGVGPLPSFNNVQALNVEYYSQALQSLIEDAEECLDRGLGIGWGTELGTEFDIDNLLRMDSVTQADVVTKLVGGAVFSPNEARAKYDKPPMPGGESPYLQQQNYSIEALAKRDAQDDPFASKAPAPPPAAPANPGPKGDQGPPGKDADPEIVRAMIKDELAAKNDAEIDPSSAVRLFRKAA